MGTLDIKKDINELLSLIDTTLNQLNSASNWGLYDIFKGGMLTSLIKNSKISDAENNISRMKFLLSELDSNLKDYQINNSIDLDISDFLKFTDIFMDNIFSDVMVQNKIKDSISNLNVLKSELERIYKNI